MKNSRFLFTKTTIQALCLLCLLFGLAPSSARAGGLSLGFDTAWGEGGAAAVDLSLRYTFYPWINRETVRLRPYLEASGIVWAKSGESLGGAAAAFGLDLDITSWDKARPFVSASFGPAYLSDNEFNGHNLGCHTQFRTRGSFGLRFGPQLRHKLAADYTHYSNARMNRDNDGYNTFGLSYGFAF